MQCKQAVLPDLEILRKILGFSLCVGGFFFQSGVNRKKKYIMSFFTFFGKSLFFIIMNYFFRGFSSHKYAPFFGNFEFFAGFFFSNPPDLGCFGQNHLATLLLYLYEVLT